MNETHAPVASLYDAATLHMRAINSLSRCKHMLMANEPMYTFALKDLEEAQKAVTALMAMVTLPATQQGALA